MHAHYFHNISILLVMIGLCFMIVSLKISLKINELKRLPAINDGIIFKICIESYSP